MPKIAKRTGDPVRTTVVKGPRARPEAVGAGISAQLGNILGAVQIGTKIAGMGADRVNAINTTEAEEGVVKFERAKNELFFNPDNGYFNTQGKSAYDTSEDANKSLQKLAREYASGMSNPDARNMFMSVANKHITSGQSDILRHASKGIKAWEISTIKAQTENTIENASLFRGDPERLSVQRELGRESIRDAAKLEGDTGISLNERLQTYDSAFASATIDSSIIDNAEAGKNALDKYGSMLEGDKRQRFEKEIEELKKSEKDQSDSQQVVSMASVIATEYRGDRKSGLAKIDEIKDVTLRSKVRSHFTTQFNINDVADAEHNADRYDEADKIVKKQGIEVYKAENQLQFDKFSADQQRKLEKGGTAGTDWITWTDVNLMSPQRLSEMSRTEFEKIAPKLDRSQRTDFTDRWTAAQKGDFGKPAKAKPQFGRSNSSQTKDLIEGVIGKPTRDFTANQKEYANTLYSLIDDEYNNLKESKGAEPSSGEVTDMLNRVRTQIYLKDPYWSGPRLTLHEGPYRDQIKAFLETKGIKDPSDQDIMDVHTARVRGR